MCDADGRSASDFPDAQFDALWSAIFEMEEPVCDLACAGEAVLRLAGDDDALAWAAYRLIDHAERVERLYSAAFAHAAALRKQKEARA